MKPDNILIDEVGHIKLADFGLSKLGIEDYDLSKSFCGSYAYLAPEMVNKSGHTKIMDWYQLGVVLYEFLEGRPPYYDNDKDTLLSNIIKNKLDFPQHISDTCKDLLSKLLEKDPTKRLGFTHGAEEIKAHPWFDDIDWDDIKNKRIRPFKPYLYNPNDISKFWSLLIKNLFKRFQHYIMSIVYKLF